MNALTNLTQALRCLPGVGPKSAQRIAYTLLSSTHQRERGLHLAACLERAIDTITHCERCNNYTEHPLCHLCLDPSREASILCVVETPADIIAIEQCRAYQGQYYVLMGKISPLDGIGPEDIALKGLQKILEKQDIQEVILALSPSVEGQTTVHFIQTLLKPYPIRLSQFAHGIPVGGELEFLDTNTISNALRNRNALMA